MNTPVATEKTSLHTNLVALDRNTHRALRLTGMASTDFGASRGMNALPLNAVEFVDAVRDFPVVFVRTASDAAAEGAPAAEVIPVVVLGLQRGENLFLQGEAWKAAYIPAALRAYPFAMGRMDEQQYVVCIDQDSARLSSSEGERLFDDAGEPTDALKAAQQFLELLENEMQRTRQFCQRLVELGLLSDMRFEAKLESGESIVADGFLSVDEKKLAELSDAQVLELQRSGMLMLVHAQMVSVGHMRQLVQRRLEAAAKAGQA